MHMMLWLYRSCKYTFLTLFLYINYETFMGLSIFGHSLYNVGSKWYAILQLYAMAIQNQNMAIQNQNMAIQNQNMAIQNQNMAIQNKNMTYLLDMKLLRPLDVRSYVHPIH